ncbi:atrial natriuretic peptide receptor 2-like [Nematostella vectensis]|uniref:atrial natriuretic peptide receptor 2-like n=1 Tax=Nematostella vectensis TaxID=45351 RepID=UPI0020779B25|nr:atrial natriuretic peptide receptor 2-like [Nematostella vectensis]
MSRVLFGIPVVSREGCEELSQIFTNHSIPREDEERSIGKIPTVAQVTGDSQSRKSLVAGNSQAEMVAVKIMRKKEIRISRKILIEVKQARELRHENINLFIGICLESPQILIISKYLKRGSLQLLLKNEDFKLKEIFILSLIRDVATGMTVLQSSPVQVHGRLKSSNCLIDSRWVCKIGDWGLGELRSSLERLPQRKRSTTVRADMLWAAPERIHDGKLDIAGSQKGDVYSYGIIFQEIATRGSPYCMFKDLTPNGTSSLC